MWNGFVKGAFRLVSGWTSGHGNDGAVRVEAGGMMALVEGAAASGGGRAGWVARRAGAAWIGWPPR
jgi:hypothetical protein